MIARALSTEPKLVLADEPTGSLDTQRGREVLGLLGRDLPRARRRGVLVTHDPAGGRLRGPRARAARRPARRLRARSMPSHRSMPADAAPRVRGDEAVEHRSALSRAPAREGRAGAVRGARHRGRRGAAVRLAGGEHEPRSARSSSSPAESSGKMRFQLASRDPHGFDERLLGQVESLPGVRIAVPVLEAERERGRSGGAAVGRPRRHRTAPRPPRRPARAQVCGALRLGKGQGAHCCRRRSPRRSASPRCSRSKLQIGARSLPALLVPALAAGAPAA